MTPHASNKKNPENYDDEDEHCKDELIRCAEVPQLNECYEHGNACQKVNSIIIFFSFEILNTPLFLHI